MGRSCFTKIAYNSVMNMILDLNKNTMKMPIFCVYHHTIIKPQSTVFVASVHKLEFRIVA